MLILSNIAKLYDGSSAELSAVHAGVDLHIDGGRIHELRPHDPALTVGDGHTRFVWEETLVFPWWMGGPIGGAVGAVLLRAVWKRNLRLLGERFTSDGR